MLAHLASSYFAFKEPVVVPKYDGYLQLEWHSRDRTLEIEANSENWSVMGAVRRVNDSDYFTGRMELNDLDVLNHLYLWWAENRLIWPLW